MTGTGLVPPQGFVPPDFRIVGAPWNRRITKVGRARFCLEAVDQRSPDIDRSIERGSQRRCEQIAHSAIGLMSESGVPPNGRHLICGGFIPNIIEEAIEPAFCFK